MNPSFPTRLLAVCLASSALAGDGGTGLFVDLTGDAMIRHTTTGADGLLPPNFDPIDLIDVQITGWTTQTPTTNPWNGSASTNANLLRLAVRFHGVVSPPGPLGFGEAGAQFDPLRFGDRPVYGTIDLDADDRKNSGGELGTLAKTRYLANVARFGMVPESSFGERAATGASDLDNNFASPPQFERTGTEFALVMCGCWIPTILTQNGNSNNIFDAGETWTLRGRFLQRIESVAPVSGFFGGSEFGLFDPLSTVRWSHNAQADITTIELVFPLTMIGAGQLAGQPTQNINLSLFDHTSIEEALSDLIEGADSASGSLDQLLDDWRGRDYEDYLEPTAWHVTALIGTAYTEFRPDALYAWTDTGFGEQRGDCDTDGLAGPTDQALVQAYILAHDGTAQDADGIVNGTVQLLDFALNFSLYDFDADGAVGPCDRLTLGAGADLNSDARLDFFDVSLFLGWFSAHDARADLDGNGIFDFFDIQAYLQRFSAGCL
jgi:hypothetical protein